MKIISNIFGEKEDFYTIINGNVLEIYNKDSLISKLNTKHINPDHVDKIYKDNSEYAFDDFNNLTPKQQEILYQQLRTIQNDRNLCNRFGLDYSNLLREDEKRVAITLIYENHPELRHFNESQEVISETA